MHLHFPWISHEASLRAKRSNPGNKIADKPLVFRDDMRQAGCTKILSSRTCCAIYGLLRRIASDYSGCCRSNGRLQLTGWDTSCHGALPKIRPRNDVPDHPKQLVYNFTVKQINYHINLVRVACSI